MGTNDAWVTLNSGTDPDDSESAEPSRGRSKSAL